MTTYSTHHSTHYQQDPRDELLYEIQDLDWKREDSPPVREAAQLIYKMGNGTDHQDDDARHQEVAKLLIEVPVDYRAEVIAHVPQDLQDDMLDKMPEQVRGMVGAINGHNLSYQESEESANQYKTEPIQEWEREIVQHTLYYVEGICGKEAAHHIKKIIEDSRDMAIRELPGYQWMYQNEAPHNTHLRYLECIANIPAATETKLNTHTEGWTPEEFRETAQHEVNRMAYRMNLEIQDRLVTQFSDKLELHDRAQEKGMDQDTLDKLMYHGEIRDKYAKHCRHMESPTSEMIEQQSRACLTDMGLKKAINENDTEALKEILVAARNRRRYQERELFIKEYLGHEATEPIEKAIEISAQWSNQVIMDGGKDFHFKYADLEYLSSNDARERWMHYNEYMETRDQFAGDCVARALNQVTGGKNYGLIWREISQMVQREDPTADVDQGAFPHQYGDIYERHGMHKALDTMEDPANPMCQHLDLREIPALLEGLSDENGKPLSYIGSTRLHAVAVVEGVLQDTWDSRDMGDRTTHVEDGRVSNLWLKCDEGTAEAARNILERYARARHFDDALTQGVRWRVGN